MHDSFFRTLDPIEEEEFRQWARTNWKFNDFIDPLWHPVVRNEIYRMKAEVLAKYTEGGKPEQMTR